MATDSPAHSRHTAVLAAAAILIMTAAVLLLTATGADARMFGRVGESGNPTTGATTCARCHTVGNAPPSVTITGPTVVTAGQTNQYTVEVASVDANAVVAGFNASLIGLSGQMQTATADVQSVNMEVTHTAPKPISAGTASFTFNWTAPAVTTELTMYTAAIAANGNGLNGDDATGTTTLPIDVVGGTDEVVVTTACAAGGGEFDVTITNPWTSLAEYGLALDGGVPISVTVPGGATVNTTLDDLADGARELTVLRQDGHLAFSEVRTIACAPGGDPVPGADAPIEVAHVVSCLAGNGRVDTNIVNTGSAAALYRLEFAGLSARATTVAAGDWWRMPITGRPDGNYLVNVLRDGVTVSSQTLTVSCDSAPPVVDEPEIQVVNACRAGLGYVLFQFVNNTGQAFRSWVLEFENVPNRSTSATAFGQALRGVTGRPDGTYNVRVLSGGVVVNEFAVTVNC